MADNISQRSSFLCSYMSNHQDTLVAYVSYYGKVKDVAFAKMESIDGGGMSLSYTKADKSTGTTRISFDPPLLDYDEVRPRLTQMKLEACDGLQMAKAPQLKTFFFPPRGLTGFGILSTAALAHYRPEIVEDYMLNIIDVLPGTTATIAVLWYILATVHVVEAAGAAFLCGKHIAGPELTFKWSVATLLGGWPVLSALRLTLQRLRIASIKTE